MEGINLIGKPYIYGDWIGTITKFVTSGGFKNCYEVRVFNTKTGQDSYWWFQKEILETKSK